MNDPFATPGGSSVSGPPATSSADPVPGTPLPAQTPVADTVAQSRLIAPAWHTVIMVAIILVNSYFASAKLSHNIQSRGRILLYLSTMVWQLVLLGLIWIGLRLRKTKLRDLIGGRWNTVEDFLLDLVIAIGFWLGSALVLAGLKFAMGLASLDPKQSTEQVKQAIGAITPRTATELAVFLLLTIFAGVIEEIVFRGYLQKQIGLLARNTYVGVVIAAIIFGAGHGYQGTRQMILIAIYGAMFGMLVVVRKSLRPGMMAHAWQDALSGTLVYVLTKMGKM